VRTRFRFTAVSSTTRRPLTGVLIRFAHHRLRTGRRGRATITMRLRRPGRYRAVATVRGLHRGSVVIRVRGRTARKSRTSDQQS
jgi:hypothetical protein